MVSRRNEGEIRRRRKSIKGGGGTIDHLLPINCQLTANEGKCSYEYYRVIYRGDQAHYIGTQPYSIEPRLPSQEIIMTGHLSLTVNKNGNRHR